MDINLGLSATATGIDTITATYSPAPTLVDKKILFLRTAGTNTVVDPTFSPNGLTAHTITKNGGDALVVGDLDGDVILMYDLANTNWELLNPKVTSGTTLTQDQIDAINNASSPDGSNPFATINDIGGTPTIGQVVTAGNVVGNKTIQNGAGLLAVSFLNWLSTSISMVFNDGTKVGSVVANATKTEVSHTDLINLSAPSVTKNGVEIATTDDIVPYKFTLQGQFTSTVSSPVDNTTYYGGSSFAAAHNSTAGLMKVTPLEACTLDKVIVQYRVGTPGTNETSTVYLRFNNTTDITISSAVQTDANFQSYITTGLTQAFNGTTDYFEMKWSTPAGGWVTNPTGVVVSFVAYFKKS